MKGGHVVKYRTKKFLQDRNLFMVDFKDFLTKKTYFCNVVICRINSNVTKENGIDVFNLFKKTPNLTK